MTTQANTYERLYPYYEAALDEAEQRAKLHPQATLELPENMTSFIGAITASDQVAVIGEHKRRSPGEGDIRPDSTVEWTVARYAKGGASAVSILTQGEHFGGSIHDLAYARDATAMPILRKDFIGNEYQLHETRAYGAHAVLLIVGGLSDAQLRSLHDEAESIDLECLVEVHDEAELERALEIEPKIIGVNNRDLGTLQIDLKTARDLIPMIPDGIVKVAESGYSVRDPRHMSELSGIGADAVLMGTALMREADPAPALSAWLTTP